MHVFCYPNNLFVNLDTVKHIAAKMLPLSNYEHFENRFVYQNEKINFKDENSKREFSKKELEKTIIVYSPVGNTYS